MCPWETGRAMKLEGVNISFEERECTYLLMAFMETKEEKQVLKMQKANAVPTPELISLADTMELPLTPMNALKLSKSLVWLIVSKDYQQSSSLQRTPAILPFWYMQSVPPSKRQPLFSLLSLCWL